MILPRHRSHRTAGSFAVANKDFEGTWGAQIIDALQPRTGEHPVIKKGFGGFSNTPLDTILRAMGVSTTVRGGAEHNYRMILVKDAVAEINHETHEAELQTMARLFADVKTTDEVVAMLTGAKEGRGLHAARY